MGNSICKPNINKKINVKYPENPNNDKLLIENIKFLMKMKNTLINTCLIENVKFEIETLYNAKKILVTNKYSNNDIDIIFTEYLNFLSTKPTTLAYCRNKDCSICLESLTHLPDGTYMPITLNCGHMFHYKCINKWHKTNNICPMCREPTIITSESNRIY